AGRAGPARHGDGAGAAGAARRARLGEGLELARRLHALLDGGADGGRAEVTRELLGARADVLAALFGDDLRVQLVLGNIRAQRVVGNRVLPGDLALLREQPVHI